MSSGDERLLDPDIPKRPDVELGQRALAKPMRTRQWGNDATSSNAAPFVTGKWQQQQFQLNFCPIFGAAKDASHEGLIFINHRGQDRIDLISARVAPNALEGLAFQLTRKQCADLGAGKTKSYLVSEIRRQHECIAQCIPNIRRVDVRTCRGPAPASPPIPVVKQFTGRIVFHMDWGSTPQV